MTDKIDKQTRSRVMASIRSKGNKSTELKLRMILVRAGLSGWKVRPKKIRGNPDFIFPDIRLAIFADGCLWHGCPKCGIHPKSNLEYWGPKLARNKVRDRINRVQLKREGWMVLRIWEHELRSPAWALFLIEAALSKRGGAFQVLSEGD